MNLSRWVALLGIWSVTACDGRGPAGTASPSTTASSRPTSTTEPPREASAASAAPPPTASASSDPAPAIGSAAASAAPLRSPAPTLAEWDSEKREVVVKGSSALGCETKLVREWLRVRCSGLSDTNGAPLFVRLTRGDFGRSSTDVGEGTISLVVPYVEGIDDEYTFTFSDRDYRLILRWPKGAPRPTVLGVFEGALSPLDGKRVPPKSSCKGAPYNPDCERTHRGNCEKIKHCAQGHYEERPQCQEHFRLGPQNWCFRMCTVDGDCPVGEKCHDDFGPPSKVCFRSIGKGDASDKDGP